MEYSRFIVGRRWKSWILTLQLTLTMIQGLDTESLSTLSPTPSLTTGIPFPSSTLKLESSSSNVLLPTTTTLKPKPTPTLKPKPTPTPSPSPLFLRYKNSSVFLSIDEISIEYDRTTVHTGKIAELTIINSTVTTEYEDLIFRRYYGLRGKVHFFISFTFRKEPPNWLIYNFQHLNFTDDLYFQYKGIQYGITAPVGLAYKCSTMKFHGSAGATGEDIVESSLSFNGIYIQAFFKDEASSDYMLCGGNSNSSKDGNELILLLAGIGGGLCLLVLILITVISAICIARSRRRSYDLLKD